MELLFNREHPFSLGNQKAIARHMQDLLLVWIMNKAKGVMITTCSTMQQKCKISGSLYASPS